MPGDTSGRLIFDRAPLMQSRQMSLPLSSISSSGSVGLPQTAQLESRLGRSSGGGGPAAKAWSRQV